jgi:alanine dehydrogenase
MIVGVPKEIKTAENRVAMVPAGADTLIAHGHKVLVQKNAGVGSGFDDSAYKAVGAIVTDSADEVWAESEMIVKVKEPIPEEYPRVKRDHVVFTYFHYAADERLTRAMLETGAVTIAYETVQLETGELPLLTPMSEVAGRMAVQEGAKYLEKTFGGLGILLGGVPGVHPAEVAILGGGIVGTQAAWMAAGLGARVTVLDVNLERLRYLDDVMPRNVVGEYSNRHNILDAIKRADLVVGAVLLPGAKAPHLVCVETVKPTTHEDPTYVVEGVIHYCVANMPGAVPRTSTLALTNATFPYALKLADDGWEKACRDDHALALGVNTIGPKVTCLGVAEAFGLDYTPVEQVLG